MAQAYDQIEEQALTLSPEERERLAERLLESVHILTPKQEEEHLQAWGEEAHKRMLEVDSGAVKMERMDDVLQELREKYP